MNDYNFGNFVCTLREKNGLTQAEIADRLGVTAAAVSKWENGSSKPRVEVLFKLAEILGVRPDELMAGHYIEENNSFTFILATSIIAIVFAALESSKDTEEYRLGYEYLLESNKFAELGLSEDDIRFNSFRKNKTTNADGEKVTNVELGFNIGSGRSMYVTCHNKGAGWYVCTDCTEFE